MNLNDINIFVDSSIKNFNWLCIGCSVVMHMLVTILILNISLYSVIFKWINNINLKR